MCTRGPGNCTASVMRHIRDQTETVMKDINRKRRGKQKKKNKETEGSRGSTEGMWRRIQLWLLTLNCIVFHFPMWAVNDVP